MSTAETKICQSCKQSFVIEPDDFDFYKKIDVPPPTWCPACRNRRRSSWREDRTLYKGTCDLCKKSIITVQAPGSPFTVYCRPCWQSDRWDPMTYGRDYDFNQPFFAQYRKLMEVVPRPALIGSNNINCDYSNSTHHSKNCYFVFKCFFSENSENSYGLLLSKNSFDAYITDNSDLAYEALHSSRLYRVSFSYFSTECLDSSFIYDCVGCSNCFGCTSLRKQKYWIWNKRVAKDEYVEAMKYWDLGSYKRLEEAKDKFKNLYASVPHRYAHVLNSVNVSGDIIRDSKNCQVCFSALNGVENCKYLFFGGFNLKDSYDVTAGGDLSELLYESANTMRSQKCLFSAGSGNSNNIQYCDWSENSSNAFGCINLRNKQYCILNKQYSKEEYFALVKKIKAQMNEMPYRDAKGRVYRYGEFFPAELSAYAYNESFAFDWYPKTRKEVEAEGLRWQEPPARDYKTTLLPEDLPDHIRDVQESITKEIIGCAHASTVEASAKEEGGAAVAEGPRRPRCNHGCSTAFRISPEELAFYKQMNIALPRLCPSCRHLERRAMRNGLQIWKRHCLCKGKTASTQDGAKTYENASKHFHGDAACPNEFETTFPPERPEIVYCAECYREEFL